MIFNIKAYLRKVAELLFSKIARYSATVFSGLMVSKVFSALTIIVLARMLGPNDFGLLAIFFATMELASQLSDFGLHTTLVRFVSLYSEKNKTKALLICKVTLKTKVLAAFLVTLSGLYLAEPLAIHVLKNSELVTPFKFAFIGSFAASLLLFNLSLAQAMQCFKRYTFLNILDKGSITIVILSLVFIQKISFLGVMIVYISLPVLTILIGFLLFPLDFLKVKNKEKGIFLELLHFSKWIMVIMFSAILLDRIGIFFLNYYKQAEVVGYFYGANKLIQPFQMITFAFVTTLLPKISRYTNYEDIKRYIKNTLMVTVPFSISILIIFLLSTNLLISLVFGDRFIDSIPIFQALLPGYMLNIITIPINCLLLYTFDKPKYVAFIAILRVILSCLAYVIFIPHYGAIGVAIIYTIIILIGEIIQLFLVSNHLKKMKNVQTLRSG